jgi:hypothetical protein
VTLSLALAAHVADEALTDFLAVYNPFVRSARERFGVRATTPLSG